MPKTYINALVYDKGSLGIEPGVRKSLRTFYQRNLYMDNVYDGNPIDFIIEETEDQCLNKAAEKNFDYLILTWEGNIFDIYRYHTVCVDYINSLGDDWLVAGHIMDQYQNRLLYNDPKAEEWKHSFWLFPITAIVNIKKWKELDRPNWGGQDGKQTVRESIPSVECVHDNYTPLNLQAGNNNITVNTKKGWSIIDSSMANNIPVFNLNNDIRSCQNYLYPENNVEKYNKFWTSVQSIPKLTDQYKKVLDNILPGKNPSRIKKETWQCFIKNTENYFPEEANNDISINYNFIETIALPSSGFKDFILSMSTRSSRTNVDIIHFDIIKECVEIKRKIIEQWDGSRDTFSETILKIGSEYRQNPVHTFHMHSMKNVIEAYDHMLPYFHNEEDLKECWQQFKTFNHIYIEADLLDDPWPVIKLIKNKNLYVCLSDIAGWRNNIIAYGYQNLRADIVNCLTKIKSKGIDGYVDYKDPSTDLQLWQTFDESLNYLNEDIQ